jgi:2-phospho-L-lactate guanylyltransferase
MATWAVIPVKSLGQSKSRLARVLSADERAALTRRLLVRTLTALQSVPTLAGALVISPDASVLELAMQYGAQTVPEVAAKGLNAAVRRGAVAAVSRGATGILVLPADLPFISPDDVMSFLEAAGSVQARELTAACPDRAGAGTNALLLAPPLPFTFRYGPASFQRHLQEGRNHRRSVLPVSVPGLQFDLDTEEDWHIYQIVQRQVGSRQLTELKG